MTRRITLIMVLFFLGGVLFAGDIATYINLGFSDNSRYFMFGQYGVEENLSHPYAEIYTVNVSANDFTRNGVKKAVYSVQASPGQEGMGALLTLLEGSISLINTYGINHLKMGRLLYILLNGEEPKSLLKFRDFNTNSNYTVHLIQAEYSTSDTVQASFHLDVTITEKSGRTRNFIVGRPAYRRSNVKSYKIRQIFLSPDERSLVFLIEKEEKGTSGVNIRYMVETVTIK